LIDLKEQKVHIEPAGDYSGGYFRDRLFFQQDPDSQMVNMPRVFIHNDSVTLSIAPVERFKQEPIFARKLEAGPKDTIEARQHRSFPESQMAAADAYARHGNAVRTGISPGKDRLYLQKDFETGIDSVRGSRFTAGFNPRSTESKLGGPASAEELGLQPRETLVSEPGVLAPETIPYAKRTGGSRTASRPAGYPRSSRMAAVVEPEPLSFGASRQIGKDALGDPNLVTARDAARVLLKKGMSADTKINVRVTPLTYAHSPEETAAWTLRDLVNTEFSLTNLSALQEEASFRGYRAIPKGRGIILESLTGEHRREFSQQLEAMEALGRIPLRTDGPKIEAELERSWGYGFERSFDADIDSEVFRPIEFMQSGIHEMMQGQRQLVTVWSKDGGNLTAAVDATAKAMNLDSSMFNILELPGAARGRTQFAIYNRNSVAQALQRYAPALEHIGAKPTGNVVADLQQLAAKRQGLAFLYGGKRDPMDSLLYTFLRERGEKELWSKAPVDVDNLGPYRTFSQGIRDEVKNRNLRSTQPQVDPSLPIAGTLGASPDGPVGGSWKDLKDEVGLPSDFYFTPRDADGPPPMAEPEPDFMVPEFHGKEPPPPGSGGSVTFGGGDDSGPVVLKDTSSAVSHLWWRFRIPGEHFQAVEKHTGIPMYQWFSALENGRAQVEASTKRVFGELALMGRKLPKEERKRVQLLLETKHSDAEAYQALSRTVSPAVREMTDKVEGMYHSFFEGLEYSREDVSKMLGNFPHVRASGGDYKVWVRGRAGLPKPMVDLANDLNQGVINLDERDLDFTTLARRVFRASANAKHLRPVWDDVDHALKIFSNARGDSTEFTNYFMAFDQYRREAMHLPDSLAISIDNFVQKSWKAVFGKELPKDEAIDLVGTLTSFNYYANMGFQVGMVARNYLQTLQTTYPAIGAKHTADAIRWGLKWRKDIKLQEDMMRRGVVARDAFIEPLRDVQRLVVESKAGEKFGKSTAKVMDALDYGVRWYQSADNFNKVVAWRAQYTKAKEAGDLFLEKKISWSQYMRASGGNRLVEDQTWSSGLGIQVQEALTHRGDSDLAASMLAGQFARYTQFQYTRGNVPYFLQSTLGRLLGQYGTWPSYYSEFLLGMLRRGTPGERVEGLARWAAANTAIYGGLGYAFGADFSRWTFLAPTSYTGGPIAQFLQQGMGAYNAQVTGEDDPVAKIESKRLSRFATTQVLPLPVGAMRNYYTALDSLRDENYGDFVRRTLGLPKDKQ